MNITAAQLLTEYDRAFASWPFIGEIEDTYGLPFMLLFAVGSRETNLTNEVGDGGHGHGVWQLDDRSHPIPAGFGADVPAQATTAARMLHDLLAEYGGKVAPALAAYNAGTGTVAYNLAHGLNVDTGTAGGDYAADTMARMEVLQRMARTLSDADVAAIAAAVWSYGIPEGRRFVGHGKHHASALLTQCKNIVIAVEEIAGKLGVRLDYDKD